MYSWTNWCDLTLRKGVTVKEAEKVFNEIEGENSDNDNEPDLFKIITRKDINGKETNEVEITLPSGGWKIISYWYEDTLDMLEKLATILDGTWALQFETREEAADINFQDGNVTIDTGYMNWTNSKIKDLRMKE